MGIIGEIVLSLLTAIAGIWATINGIRYISKSEELHEKNISYDKLYEQYEILKNDYNILKEKEQYINKTKTEIENEILKERIKEYYHNDL